MRASENALLKQLVLSTNIKTAWAATWFVLFLNWFQGIFPGENVFWVVPQLQDSPAQTWRHAAHKFVPGTLGLELSVDSYFQSGYFQMLPQHVLHPWVPSQWLWPLNLLQCPSPQELFFFVTDLFFHSRETAQQVADFTLWFMLVSHVLVFFLSLSLQNIFHLRLVS